MVRQDRGGFQPGADGEERPRREPQDRGREGPYGQILPEAKYLTAYASHYLELKARLRLGGCLWPVSAHTLLMLFEECNFVKFLGRTASLAIKSLFPSHAGDRRQGGYERQARGGYDRGGGFVGRERSRSPPPAPADMECYEVGVHSSVAS